MGQRNAAGWIWADAFDLLARAERLQRQFFRIGAPRESQAVWEPPVDLVESEAGLDLTIALPGVRPENLRVAFDGQALQISALRPLPVLSDGVIHRLEIPYGRFERRVPVPAGRYSSLEQTYADGCLHLHLRKAPAYP